MKVIWAVRDCHCPEVLLVEKDVDNEPVVSMDHVSIREGNTILKYVYTLAGRN